MVKIGTVSESLEDYLEIISHLIEEKKVARVRDIADRKKVKMPSVIGALKRLSDEGFINYSVGEFVEFTEKGKELAYKVTRRHAFIHRFFTDVLGVSPDTADEDACVLEHILSEETLEKMVAFYGFVTSCPEGGKEFLKQFSECCVNTSNYSEKVNTCKDTLKLQKKIGKFAKRKFQHHGFKSLDKLKENDRARVLRLKAPGEIKSTLVEKGVLPGAELVCTASQKDSNSITIKIDDYTISLTFEEAEGIDVALLD